MGNVLIRWDPAGLIARLGVTGADAKALMREVFCDQEWTGLDRGRLTEEEAIAAFRERLPEHLHEALPRLVYWWKDPMWPVEGMGELVAELKAAGYRIYLCSNATSALHTYFPRIPGSEHFDGLLVSADWKLLKPQHEIFELLYKPSPSIRPSAGSSTITRPISTGPSSPACPARSSTATLPACAATSAGRG